MTVPANVLAFVAAQTTPKTLDSLHGNIGFDDYDIAIQNHKDMRIDIDKYQQIQALKMTLGTKIFAMDKGASAMANFFDNNPALITHPLPGWEMIDFTDFRVYREEPGPFYYRDLYMDCQRVVLPAKVPEALEKSARGWVVRSKDDYYFMPELCYPKSLKPFLKWLKKTKRVNIKVDEIWNKTITVQEKCNYGVSICAFKWSLKDNPYPMKLIKSRKDLDDYNYKYLAVDLPADIDKAIADMKADTRGCNYSSDIRFLKNCKKLYNPALYPFKPADFPVTQQMIDEYLSYRNDCYQIIGK